MQLAYAFLAKALEVVPGGCFSALGVDFDTIGVEDVPAEIPVFFTVCKVWLDRTEIGKHSMWAAIRNPLGVEKEPKDKAEINVDESSFGEGSRRGATMFAATSLKVENFGHYSINIYFDGKELVSLPLLITKPQAEQAVEKS